MTPLRTSLCAAILGFAALIFAPGMAAAQGASGPQAILVLNQDRLLSQSLYGQRLQSEVEAASAQRAAENRRIEAQLTAEELELTELRPLTPPDEFRVLADDIDTRVNGIRAAQDARARDLQLQSEAAQLRVFDVTFEILLSIVEARGGSVLLDSRSVLLSAGSVDITEAAIAAIDAEIGNGGDTPLIALPGVTDVDLESPEPSDD